MNSRTSIVLVVFTLFLSCTEKDKDVKSERNALGKFISVEPVSAGITFRGDITETEEMNGLTWEGIYSGGGVGIGDINNDGLADLFFAGNQVDDALYLNRGDFTFEDISKSSGITGHAGWSTGVSMVDINSDGYLDIYVCRNSWKKDNEDPDLRRNKLFINNGDNTFKESAAEYGLDHFGYSTQASFMDHDKDGDLDMFLLATPSNNLEQKIQYSIENTIPDWASDQFYLNDNGTFKNVTKEVGMESISFGLGVVAADLDHDMWVDIYVANDYDRPDLMYINQKDGTFKNFLNQKVKHTSFTSMGCDAADINNDGLVDLGVVDMQSADHFRSKTNMPSMDEDRFWSMVDQGFNHQYMSNVLQLNNGVGYFSDVAQHAGMASTDWSWAILMADYDNDRKKDIFISNGINKDLRNNDFGQRMEKMNIEGERVDYLELSQELPSSPLSNFLYLNKGELKFIESAEPLGVGQPSFSFGAAYGDLDNDGDLDLVVNNNEAPPFIYKNELSNNNYIKIKVIGPKMNPLAFGTKVFAYVEGEILYQELNPVRGYQSSCEAKVLLGLGQSKQVDSLICIFPDDKNIVLYKPEINKELELDHINATKKKIKVYNIKKPLFSDQTLAVGLDHLHFENELNDFDEQVLLPHMRSRIGPGIAVGDMNGDDLDDLYVCGASGSLGQMFIQEEDGRFTKKEIPALQTYKGLEEVDAVIADLNGDGYNDLFIVSGGGEKGVSKIDRIYTNNGKGDLVLSDALPENYWNGSCAEICDFDADGDLDIFVGGSGVPMKYPFPGNSVLYENVDGQFRDVTEKLAPSLRNIGMVSDATWADINGDDLQDLIVVGEWMKPTAFIQDEGRFVENLEWFENAKDHFGWFFHINSDDINNDGKQDFVLGNIGLNNKFHPSVDKPLRVYGSDFDQNSSNDIVLAKNYKGKIVPTRGRECSSEQLPFISEEFETFESFANASIENLLGERLEGALELSVNDFSSGVILSTDKGYVYKPFPSMAQISPIMGSVVYDIDKDGIKDIVIAGNLFDAEVETTRYDSGNGLLLKGLGNGEFEPYTAIHTGFYAPTNVRTISLMEHNSTSVAWIVVGSNDNRLTAFAFKK